MFREKMKERLKGAVIGAILMLGLVTTMPVLARVAQETITVHFNNIRIVVDGQEVQTELEPFIFEERTYLPVRDVANAAGLEVLWEAATNTVYLTSQANQESIENAKVVENVQDEELNIQIARASNELLNTFTDIFEVDYTLLREARDGGNIEIFNGDRLTIWANIPVYDFELIAFGNDSIDGEDGFIFIPFGEALGTVDELLPGQAFVINSYVGLGTLPWSGISFVEGNGEKRYFAIIQDQSDSPVEFVMWEFENRTGELPQNWSPWWLE